MRFHFPLICTLYFAVAALADRRREHRRSRYLNRATDPIEYNPIWAGAAVDKMNGTLTSITGTFKVPIPSGKAGSVATAWVGLDGHTCYNGGLLQTGIDFVVGDNGPTYDAWFEWFPSLCDYFNLSISAGDVIRANVTALSSTSGIATIEDLTTGQRATKELNSTHELCRQDAEWVVEDYPDADGDALPLDDFGEVTFTDAKATGPSGTFTPQDGVLMEIEQNGTVLTSVSVNGNDLVIKHV